MKKICLTGVLICSFNTKAFDLVFKTEYQKNNTDNVNSSTTKVKDQYSDLIFNFQVKNEEWKWRSKFKIEKYKTTTSNDSRYISTGIVHKPNKLREYTFDVYQLKYSNTPTNTSDTSSDNQGFKISGTFSKKLHEENLGYFTILANYKKYTKITTRTDTLLDLSLGYEANINADLLIVPDLTFEYNNSKDSYYTNFNITPSVSLTYFATDNLELSSNASLTQTNYKSRAVTTTNTRSQPKERQTLVSLDVGATYTLFDHFPITAKYASYKNTSNNSSSAYDSKVTSLNFGLKF